MENEKKENWKKIFIILLIIIIMILLTLVLLFATGIIKFKFSNFQNNNVNLNNEVDINLSIDNVVVDKDAPNSKIAVTGTINLSYDSSKYRGVKLSGYCFGTSGEKYHIIGPGDGRTLFYNDGNNYLALAEGIPQNIEYSDGTSKSWDEVDWSNVKIKYCKIDKMTAILNGVNNLEDWPERVLNFEKSFSINENTIDNNLSKLLPSNVKNLYVNQINEFFKENQYYDKSNVRFDLIYFNDDDIMDLVIMPDLSSGGVYGIYVYNDNKIYRLSDSMGTNQFISGPRGQAPCYYAKESIMLWHLHNFNHDTNNTDSENTYYVLNNNVLDTYSYIFSTLNDKIISEKYYYNNQESDINKYNTVNNKMKNLQCNDFDNNNKMTYDEIMTKLK